MGQVSPEKALQGSVSAALAAPDAERVGSALSSALAENTLRADLGHWAAFGEWSGRHGYSPAPTAGSPSA